MRSLVSGLALVVVGFVLMLVLGVWFPVTAQQSQSEAGQVEAVRRSIYQSLMAESAELEASPTVDSRVYFSRDGQYALGGWNVGEMSGVSVLQQQSGQWVERCATGGTYSPQEMVEFCKVPLQQAQELFEQIP